MASSGKPIASGEKIIIGAIFASGSGTNAENILRFAHSRPEIKIAVVICDQPGAGVIDRAEKFGVACEVIPAEKGAKVAHEKKVLERLSAHNVDWIFLAGYMRILSPDFIMHFPNRIVNIHPSLLPEFPGKDSYRRAYDAGVKTAGITLHYVDAGIDTGPVIKQKKFDRIDGESFDDFRARGLALEYQAYTEFLEELCHDRCGQDRNRA